MNALFDIPAGVPVTATTLRSMFPNLKSAEKKIGRLEANGTIIRLKNGLYVVSPEHSGRALHTELIANHLYSPSYVSMSSALRYYGLIPEAVYTTQSMTVKHAHSFNTPLGHFDYKHISTKAFHIGVRSIITEGCAFLMASPEKALCDLIANSPGVNLRYLKDADLYLEEDIRLDMDEFFLMDASILEEYATVGKKRDSIQTLIKYMQR